MRKGLVSVICVNWNGEAFIRRTIDSVLSQTYKPVEVIVVDNNSGDNSARLISEHYPQARLILKKENLGWGGGLNEGLKVCEGEYVVTLNNDLWMDARCVEEMVAAVNRDSRYGACASKVCLGGDGNLIDVAGVGIFADGMSYARGRLKPREMFDKEEEVFCASGCCSLIRKEVFDDVGLFDAAFFMYAEDTEIGWRHQKAGWRCIYAPRAVAFHAHSASAKDYSPMKAFYVERNRIWIALRHYPLGMLFLSVPWFAFCRYLWQITLCLGGKKGSLAKFREKHSLMASFGILMKAHLAAFRRALHHLRQRSASPVRISGRETRNILRRYGCTTREMASYE